MIQRFSGGVQNIFFRFWRTFSFVFGWLIKIDFNADMARKEFNLIYKGAAIKCQFRIGGNLVLVWFEQGYFNWKMLWKFPGETHHIKNIYGEYKSTPNITISINFHKFQKTHNETSFRYEKTIIIIFEKIFSNFVNVSDNYF